MLRHIVRNRPILSTEEITRLLVNSLFSQNVIKIYDKIYYHVISSITRSTTSHSAVRQPPPPTPSFRTAAAPVKVFDCVSENRTETLAAVEIEQHIRKQRLFRSLPTHPPPSGLLFRFYLLPSPSLNSPNLFCLDGNRVAMVAGSRWSQSLPAG